MFLPRICNQFYVARKFLNAARTTKKCYLVAMLRKQEGRYFSSSMQKDDIQITFVRANGDKIVTMGKVGDSLLDVVVNNNIDLDGYGACEGTLTCSTCHLIFNNDDYEKLPNKPSDEELDMLDLAFDLTDTSRLGCQIMLTTEIDGLEVQVPPTINDARST